MTHIADTPGDPSGTVPPPTPGDALVGRVIGFVGTVALLCVAGVIGLAGLDRDVPAILEHTTTGAVTGLVALLAGRTQR